MFVNFREIVFLWLRRIKLYGRESRRTSRLLPGEQVLRSRSEESFVGPRGPATPDTTSSENRRLARSRSMSREFAEDGSDATSQLQDTTSPQSSPPYSDGGTNSPGLNTMDAGVTDRSFRPAGPAAFPGNTPQLPLYGPAYFNPTWGHTPNNAAYEQHMRTYWNSQPMPSKTPFFFLAAKTTIIPKLGVFPFQSVETYHVIINMP